MAAKNAKTNKTSPTSARYSDRVRAHAIRLAKKRKSVPEIHQILNKDPKQSGPTAKTIRVWLKQAGVSPGTGRPRQFDRKKILRDLNATKKDGTRRYTRAQLCEKYGCSQKFLSNLANGEIAP